MKRGSDLEFLLSDVHSDVDSGIVGESSRKSSTPSLGHDFFLRRSLRRMPLSELHSNKYNMYAFLTPSLGKILIL